MDKIITIADSGITEAQTLERSLFSRWVNYLDVSPKTLETYAKNIKHFSEYLDRRGIRAPGREDVLAYRDELSENHKSTTVQGYLTAVKLFFRWTAQEGIYPNVAEHIKGAKLDVEHKRDYLTAKQVQEVLSEIDHSSPTGKRDFAMIALMVTTGLRTISISLANVEDIRTAGGSSVLYYQGKGHTEKATYVKLAEPIESAIRDYLKSRGEIAGGAPLFESVSHRNGGGRLTTRSISRIVKERFCDVGLISDRLTAHSLRHTAATLNLLNGGTIEETKQLLNHTNINTTLIYSHALERERNNSESRIAGALF